MRGRGRCFFGSNMGRYDAVRISPTSSHHIQVRYNNGNWYDEWSSGGSDIEILEWQDNYWIDAVFSNGQRVHAVLLRP